MGIKIDKNNIDDVYSMSDIQKGMVYHSLKDADAHVYHNQTVYQWKDNGFDSETFEKALSLMVEKHSILRTGFQMFDFEEPIQIVYKRVAFDIQHNDVSHLDKPGQNEYINKALEDDKQRAFNLSAAEPLWRIKTFTLGNGDICLAWICHHAIMDGWSSASLSTELYITYSALKSDPGFVPVKLKSTYKDFIIEQDVEKRKKENIDYWKKELQDYKRLDFPGIPAGSIGIDRGRYEGKRKHYSKELGDQLFRELNRTVKKFNTSIKNVCFGAYIYMLNMLAYENDLVVGLITHNRPICKDGDKILGCFLNTVPFRMEIPVNITWSDYMKRIDNKLRELTKYNKFSLLEIARIIGDESKGKNPILDTIFTYTDFHVINQLDVENFKDDNTLSLDAQARTNTLFDFFVNTTLGEFRIAASYTDYIISDKLVADLFVCFENVLYNFISRPEIPVDNKDVMPDEEKRKLLNYFNDTGADYPREKTIHELFEMQVEKVPGDNAVLLGNTALTYRELNEEANRLARILRKRGIGAEGIAAMLMERSIEMITGILAILKAGGAYLPVDPGYPHHRIRFMLEDSGAKILLTSQKVKLPTSYKGNKITIDDGEIQKEKSKEDGSNPAHINSPTDIAYIIYTSGTTGRPKGVMIEHKNVVRLIVNDKNLFHFSRLDVWTMFHSYCFDFSVWEMYGALLYGGKLVIVPRMTARDPESYLEILRQNKVTVLNQTPSAFYNLIDVEIKRREKDLKIRYVIFGGEALKPAKLAPWKLKYPATKLVNMFGITETTVHVTYKEITDVEIRFDISNIGRPIPTTTCYVLDLQQQLLPVGVAGELCVGGDGVGRGYLKREELTREKFITNPFRTGERLYRSGDLVRMLENGEMEYLGRLDHQVQVRGFRVELGEIENKLVRHHEITGAVVTAKQSDGEAKYLHAYYVAPHKLNALELREYLAEELPDYMIPHYFVHLETFPLTANGKIDLKALPGASVEVAEVDDGEGYVPPRDEVEEKLATIWEQVLSVEKPGIRHSYFSLGGDSIRAIKVVSEINAAFETAIKIVDLYANETIEKLARRLKQFESDKTLMDKKEEVLDKIALLKNRILSQIPQSHEIEDLYPMSDIEKGMVFYYMRHAGTGIYHDQFVYPLYYKNFDLQRFYKAFALMAAKHDILRAGFNIEDFEEPVKIIYKEPHLDIEDFNISHLDQTQQEEFIKSKMEADRKNPFDAGVFPLWRMRIFILDKDNIMVLFIFNHAILDGWSVATLSVELHNTYRELEKNPGFVPDKLKSSYKEVVVNEMLEKQRQETINYWENELADYKRLDLFTASKISGDGYHRMVTQRYVFPPGWREKLQHTAAQNHTSFNHLCLGAYLYLVNMFSYENDIVIGKVTNNRPISEDGDRLLGCFLNTVPLRIQIPNPITGSDYIRLIENKMKEIKKYEWMSLFEITRVIGEKSEDRNPIFDTLYNFMDFHVLKKARPEKNTGESTGDKKEGDGSFSMVVGGSQDTNTLFDFEIDTTACNFVLVPKYNRSAISDDMVEKLCVYFQRIIEMLIHHPQRLMEKNEIIPLEEKQRILYEFNDTEAGYPAGKTISLLLEEQAAKTPDNLAVICDHGKKILYGELNRKANLLARELRQKGIGPGRLVGVIIDRSMEMIAAVIGILKAGGAYVPIEPYLHEERIGKLLANLAIECIVTNPRQQEKIGRITQNLPGIRHTLCLDFDKTNRDETGGELLENLKPWAASQDPAYVIFTSGSSGVPKGVMVKHQPVINLIRWVNRTFAVGPVDKILFITSLGFDLSVYDIFGILSSGACIRLVYADDIKEPRRLLDIMMQEGITFWDSAPAALQQLVPFFPEVKDFHEEGRLRLVFMSGDWIPVSLPDVLKETFPGVNVISLGGATEATIWSNYYPIHQVDPMWNSIPYGKPIWNAKYYILDRCLDVCPIGVAGDLYIGGQCLATAYVNDVELTAGKFIANPFVPGEKIYKTGDISRWYADGNMEFLGRKDQQVKIRGFRVELGEIESHLSKYPGIEECIVLVGESHGNRYLCAYYVSIDELEREKIRKYLLKQLPEYMLPDHFVHLEEIPLTSNGKVNRKSLPEPETTVEEEYIGPRNEVEQCLADIWSEVLGIEKSIISIDVSFFELGGQSLNVTVLAAKIHKKMNVKLPLAEIFRNPTIRELVNCIDTASKDKYTAIQPVEKRDYYPLSSAQGRLYILQQMDLENVVYNMPDIVMLPEKPDLEKLNEIVKKLIGRHESLRTSFPMVDNQPVQRIHDGVEFEIECYDSDTEDNAHIYLTSEFIRPFDLSQAPLLRVGLLKVGETAYHLLFDMHHIIGDEVSLQVLIEDFSTFRAGNESAPLKIQYKDYAHWQQESEELKKQLKAQEEYWLKEFSGEISLLDLPTDYPRINEIRFKGEIIPFTIPGELTSGLRQLAKQLNVTLTMFLMSVFKLLLAKYSGQQEIVTGTVIAGRRYTDLDNIIGFFVNMLAIKTTPDENESFSEYVLQVKEKAVNAYENQDYQFEELVSKLHIPRESGRHPLVDTVFVFQEAGKRATMPETGKKTGENRSGNQNIKPYSVSHFDLMLRVVDNLDSLSASLEYSTDLFKRSTIAKLSDFYMDILNQVVENPDMTLNDIRMDLDLLVADSHIIYEEKEDWEL